MTKAEINETKFDLRNKMKEYFKRCLFCFANFFMKTRLTEKFEYTTTKPTENTFELSFQIFYFETLSQRYFSTKFCN